MAVHSLMVWTDLLTISCINIYFIINYNKLDINLKSNLSILIRLPFGPDEAENIVEVSKVIRAIR